VDRLRRLTSLQAVHVERTIAALLVAWTMWRTWELLLHALPHTDDQAFISLRYARHLVDGHGLVWNIGEGAVEGYANFSWVLLGAAFLLTGFDPVIGLKLVGAGCLVASVPVAYWVARHWVRPLFATLPGTWITAHFGTLWWSGSGLETGAAVLLTLLTVGCGARGVGGEPIGDGGPTRPLRHRWLAAAGLSGALLGMTRAEGAMGGIGVAAAILVRALWCTAVERRDGAGEVDGRSIIDTHLRGLLAFLGPFALVWGTYMAWRFVTFDQLLPQPVYCKRHFRLTPYEMHWDYWRSAAPFAIFALLVPIRRRGVDTIVVLGPPLLALWTFAYVHPFNAGHDRYFAPTHAALIVAAVMAVPHVLALALGDRARSWRAWALVGLVFAHHGTLETPFVERTEETLPRREAKLQLKQDLALWLDARVAPDDAVVIGDTGVVGFLGNERIIDAYCNNSPEMTRPPVNRNVQRWAEAIFDHAPRFVVIHNRSDSKLRPTSDLGIYPAITAEPDFDRLYERAQVFREGALRYFVYQRRDDAPSTPLGPDPAKQTERIFVHELPARP
jgi:hypothetical protein